MITLAEELVLLAVEDDGRIAYTAGLPGFGMAVIGACLVGLSEAGRLDADLREIRVVSATPTGVPVLDKVLSLVVAGPRLAIEPWVLELRDHAHELVGLTLGELVRRGILQQSEARFLWMLKSRRYPVVDGREQKEAKLRILSTLLGEDLPTPHDTALIGLARAAGLLAGFISAAEIARLESRIDEVGGIDLLVRGVEDAIRADNAARAQIYMHPVC